MPFAPKACSLVKREPTCTKVAFVDVAADPSLVSTADQQADPLAQDVWIRTGSVAYAQTLRNKAPIPVTGCLCFDLRTGLRKHLRPVTRIQEQMKFHRSEERRVGKEC